MPAPAVDTLDSATLGADQAVLCTARRDVTDAVVVVIEVTVAGVRAGVGAFPAYVRVTIVAVGAVDAKVVTRKWSHLIAGSDARRRRIEIGPRCGQNCWRSCRCRH